MKQYQRTFVGVLCGAMALTMPATAMATASAAPAPAVAQPVDLTYASEKAVAAVVNITWVQNSKTQTVEVQTDPFGDFFDPFGIFGNPDSKGGTRKRQIKTPKREATGSGVILTSDGYIVTNNHVVEGADELTVTLNDNREYSARIIGTDKTTDLALIKINAKDLPTLPVGNSEDLKVGEWVIACGNPYGLNSTVTAGIVSAKARGLKGSGDGPDVSSFIQTDAVINPGNSGGALVNTKGELVGINAMLYSQTGSYAGYSFAIPTSIMTKVVDDLKKYGSVQRALLGIKGGDVIDYINSQKENGKDVDLGTNEGVYVAEVSDDGAGADAGLQKGDVIVAVDGKKINKMSELQEYMSIKRPGDKMSITYLHNKRKNTHTVTLKNVQGTTSVVKLADLDVLGGNFREVTSEQQKQLDIRYGLEVTKVNNGALKKAGVNRGFIIQKVNDQEMHTIDQLQKAVKTASGSKDPVLYVQGIYPTGKKAYFAIPLDSDDK